MRLAVGKALALVPSSLQPLEDLTGLRGTLFGYALVKVHQYDGPCRAAPQCDGLHGSVRVLGHIVAVEPALLPTVAWRAVGTTTAWRRPWAWALALAVLYAITDELHQGFVAGRHPSLVDVGIDAAGALIAVATVSVARTRRA